MKSIGAEFLQPDTLPGVLVIYPLPPCIMRRGDSQFPALLENDYSSWSQLPALPLSVIWHEMEEGVEGSLIIMIDVSCTVLKKKVYN